MRDVFLFKKGGEVSKFVCGSVIVDCGAEEVLGVEVIGYSILSGRISSLSDFDWLCEKVISVNYDAEVDVLSFQIVFGVNITQRSGEGLFGFDECGRLVSFRFIDPCGLNE